LDITNIVIWDSVPNCVWHSIDHKLVNGYGDEVDHIINHAVADLEK